jgi:hypothetical protein
MIAALHVPHVTDPTGPAVGPAPSGRLCTTTTSARPAAIAAYESAPNNGFLKFCCAS